MYLEIRQFTRDEQGQDLVEYAFLAACIALLITGTLTASESSISAVYSRIIASVNGAS